MFAVVEPSPVGVASLAQRGDARGDGAALVQRALGEEAVERDAEALELRAELPKTAVGKLSKLSLYEEERRRAATAAAG